jgi:hypothetical protein
LPYNATISDNGVLGEPEERRNMGAKTKIPNHLYVVRKRLITEIKSPEAGALQGCATSRDVFLRLVKFSLSTG